MWAAMTQGFYKMFQRAAAELRHEPGGDGGAANTYSVQAPQEIHPGGHHHAQGALMFIYNIYVPNFYTLYCQGVGLQCCQRGL